MRSVAKVDTPSARRGPLWIAPISGGVGGERGSRRRRTGETDGRERRGRDGRERRGRDGRDGTGRDGTGRGGGCGGGKGRGTLLANRLTLND
ncbi:hypothetical protein FGL91_07075 [Microbacterium sp. CBA3102]|nr:hypothetical protein FGL91_07075 [Microbacterium sp. CBA3102]